ncbi:thiamine transporter [Coprothermobacteraceae bacterium]|nr:thiamine transporter [Coprothermobacteraceae bacterium]
MLRNTRMLAEAGVMVALSLALWYLNVGRLPQGGSISLQMLPLLVFALRWGVGPGLAVGVAYGLLHSLQDLYLVHPIQYVLDYPLAFGLIGLAGIAKGLRVSKGVSVALALVILLAGIGLYQYTMNGVLDVNEQISAITSSMATATGAQLSELQSQLEDLNSKAQLFPVGAYVVLVATLLAGLAIIYGAWKRSYKTPVELGVVLGGLGRFAAHWVSGYVFFSQYAPEGMNPWLYSAIYNFLVVAPSTFLSLALLLLVWPALERASSGNPH